MSELSDFLDQKPPTSSQIEPSTKLLDFIESLVENNDSGENTHLEEQSSSNLGCAPELDNLETLIARLQHRAIVKVDETLHTKNDAQNSLADLFQSSSVVINSKSTVTASTLESFLQTYKIEQEKSQSEAKLTAMQQQQSENQAKLSREKEAQEAETKILADVVKDLFQNIQLQPNQLKAYILSTYHRYFLLNTRKPAYRPNSLDACADTYLATIYLDLFDKFQDALLGKLLDKTQ
jgi:hypothetical protein